METFTDLLSWLVGAEGGAFILVSWALSWALEGLKWWEELVSKAKSLIILGVAVLLGLVSVWLTSHPTIVEAIAPYMQAVMYIVSAWLATQVAHRLNSLRKSYI